MEAGRPWRAGSPGLTPGKARYSPSAVAIVLGGLGAATALREAGLWKRGVVREAHRVVREAHRETRPTDTPPGSIALSRTPTRALVEYLQQRWKPGVFTDPEELELWERALSLRIPAAQAQRRRPSPSPPRAGAVAGGVKSGALWRPSPFYKSFRPGPLLGSEIGS